MLRYKKTLMAKKAAALQAFQKTDLAIPDTILEVLEIHLLWQLKQLFIAKVVIPCLKLSMYMTTILQDVELRDDAETEDQAEGGSLGEAQDDIR